MLGRIRVARVTARTWGCQFCHFCFGSSQVDAGSASLVLSLSFVLSFVLRLLLSLSLTFIWVG